MTRARKIDDKLVFPKRGKPPPIPDGYMRSDENPYILIPILVFCGKRYFTVEEIPCRGCKRIRKKQVMNCSKLGKVTGHTCAKCKGDEEWIKNYLKRSGSSVRDRA